jgi:hypothetical protein
VLFGVQLGRFVLLKQTPRRNVHTPSAARSPSQLKSPSRHTWLRFTRPLLSKKGALFGFATWSSAWQSVRPEPLPGTSGAT